jgi:hypothetical protein
MSLTLAETWVATAFRGLTSAQDAMRLFERAADEGVEATLIAAPELMNNGKGSLVHWTVLTTCQRISNVLVRVIDVV